MPSVQTFILNDESVVNSYGFRTINAGLNLDRFKMNPVILAQHDRSLATVIGRWVNLRIEGKQLLADAEFDEADPAAALIAGKVKRGFLKGASLGMLPIGKTPFVIASDDIADLVSSEAVEASIVAIPSNKVAVKLYAKEGIQMNAQEIKLSLELNKNSKQTQNMNKIILSVQTLLALGLQNTDDNSVLSAAIEKLASENATMKLNLSKAETTNTELNARLVELSNADATAFIDLAIKEGKLQEVQRESMLKLAIADLTAVKSLLLPTSAKISLADLVKNPDGTTTEMTEEKFLSLSLENQLKFKEEHADAYQQLFK
jgi:phage head maturation protease